MQQPCCTHHNLQDVQQQCRRGSLHNSSATQHPRSRLLLLAPAPHSRRSRPLLVVLLCMHILYAPCATAAAQAPRKSPKPGVPRPPCIACNDCITSSCLRVCMPSCKTATAMDGGSPLTAEQCKHKGQEAAADIAVEACKQSQALCQVSSKPPARFASVGTVSASQCAALANAGCQKMASSPTYSPCGANQFFGHRACSGRQFSDTYRVKVGELCLGVMQGPGAGR